MVAMKEIKPGSESESLAQRAEALIGTSGHLQASFEKGKIITVHPLGGIRVRRDDESGRAVIVTDEIPRGSVKAEPVASALANTYLQGTLESGKTVKVPSRGGEFYLDESGRRVFRALEQTGEDESS